MRTTALLSVLVLACVGCDHNPATPSSETPRVAEAPPKATPSATPNAQAKASDVMDGCPGEDQAMCGSIEQGSSDQSHFGKAFQLTKRETLTAAMARLAESKSGETVQISGVVDAVCQKKGCWMVLNDGEVSARVFTHAGKFFLPLDVNKGRKCIVEGTLEAKTVSEKFAKHLAEDEGKNPATVEGDKREWVVQATSIELL